MKTLTLTIAEPWFSMIRDGKKKEEYREIKDHYFRLLYNYAMEEKCAYVFGFILRVARYKGRFFFSSEIYTGEAFCSSAIVIDKDGDLIQRLGRETPKHAYKKSPSIEAGRTKREIEDFALNFGMAEINKWAPYLKPHVEKAVKKFSEAIAENG